MGPFARLLLLLLSSAASAAGPSRALAALPTTVADVVPPTLSITSPVVNQTLNGVVTVSTSVTDDVGVRGVAISIEGTDPYVREDSTPPYQVSLDTRTIPNGAHVLRVDAKDVAGNLNSQRIAVSIRNPAPAAAGDVPGVVVIGDLDEDGRYTGNDVQIALALCAPGCTLRALPRTYHDVEVVIPIEVSEALTIEGAGMGRTVFRSPVPWKRPVFGVHYANRGITFRDFTIDGRKERQASALVPRTPHAGILVTNPWGVDNGPGIVERVEIRRMVHMGVGLSGGNGWVVRYSRIHDIGCSDRFRCRRLKAIDPRIPLLNDPTWQSVGYGIVSESSNNTAHGNEIWNVVKIGIEAYANQQTLVPYSQLPSDFRFYDNHVHHVGSGIGSNGGRGGRIENNVVEYASGHGVFCGAQAGEIVFDGNTITNSDLYGLWVTCSGPEISVTNNTIVNNCRTGDGGGAGLLVDSGTQFDGGQGLIVRGNTVDEPYCRHAAYVTHRDHVRISGNVFRKGSSLGTLYLSNASDVTVEDGLIDGEGRVSAGIFLRGDVSGLTVRGDLVVTGYTQEKVIVSDPTTVTNVVVE